MSDRLPVGPYRTLDLGGGVTAPWYILPFDKRGECEGPRTRDHLVAEISKRDPADASAPLYTDVYLFSHGWNNDWEVASTRYDDFVTGYRTMRRDHGLAPARPYRPLLFGVFWPSTALVLPWEEGPQFAGAAELDGAVGAERREVESVAEAIDPKARGRLYELAQRGRDLKPEEALELARILSPLYASPGDEISGATDTPSAAEVLATWRAALKDSAPAAAAGSFGRAGAGSGKPNAAGLLDFLDPRHAIRLATVLQMKDRAGVVGANGVGPVLSTILAANPDARVHLIGHSYGAKVVLSALCANPLPRVVDSVLLLQPAISYLCFASDATGTGRPGGYRAAFERVEQPILTTFSPHDAPLTKFFHLAVRRDSDLGEKQIAGAPPSKYAALGGFGPGGCTAAECPPSVEMRGAGLPYEPAPAGARVIGLDGRATINGHGDISNESTWWALYNQVNR